jgi:hypothetical protein
VTAQGHPVTRFARAIAAQTVILAELAAGEMQPLQLEDALALVRLYAKGDPNIRARRQKYLARWIVEERPKLEDIAATACSFVERAPVND